MKGPLDSLIFATLGLTPFAAWVGRRRARWAMLLAAWPLLMTFYFIDGFRAALAGAPWQDTFEWVPGLSLALSFRLDGLSALFAVLITAIGAVIVVYGAHYFDGHPYSGRFQATLFAFMAAMLGVVLSDNVFGLFVFWELTGFTSYLLIGFDHDKPESRRFALQALIVTGTGGLALLGAAVLLSQVVGSASLFASGEEAAVIQRHALYTPIALCVLLAAFTKSAQFPFQFWLPNAMVAPTPVSAYLHSATMVKAGVYLVARLTPALGGTVLWTALVVTLGAFTMVSAGLRAMREVDLKKILAYSTLSALGTIMFLIGLGTPASIAAGLAYLVAHACYKGTLFLVAGIIDHETGTRDVTQLSGLRRAMPLTAVAAGLAAASVVGVPPFLGFLGKEQAYTAVLAQPLVPHLLTSVLVVSSAFLGAAGLLTGVHPFRGRSQQALVGVHEPSSGLWLGPLLLGGLGLLGLFAVALGGPLGLAASSVAGETVRPELSFWHGFTLPLLLEMTTVGLAIVIYARRDSFRRLRWPSLLGTERLYESALRGVDALSARMAPALQDAALVSYIQTFVVTTGALIGMSFFLTVGVAVPDTLLMPRTHEVLVVLLIIGAAVAAVRARTTMAAVLSLGTAGYGVALIYLLYGAPDLAMTQFAVETLTAVIFVFVFWQFPRVEQVTAAFVKRRDALVAVAFGTLVTVLTLATATHPTSSRLRDYFAEVSVPLAHGRNIVNVMLVDFRALDTLGEITVLVTAAVGVSALLRIRAAQKQER